ncbi:hypothetical protein AURDEDRAFT_187678 [Auricularia subglabra TFB-10046 SS5]|nr:hypothetical protein AURDEDRAFT_187678 [Auricularia subglabra TFB-10046 SS5]
MLILYVPERRIHADCITIRLARPLHWAHLADDPHTPRMLAIPLLSAGSDFARQRRRICASRQAVFSTDASYCLALGSTLAHYQPPFRITLGPSPSAPAPRSTRRRAASSAPGLRVRAGAAGRPPRAPCRAPSASQGECGPIQQWHIDKHLSEDEGGEQGDTEIALRALEGREALSPGPAPTPRVLGPLPASRRRRCPACPAAPHQQSVLASRGEVIAQHLLAAVDLELFIADEETSPTDRAGAPQANCSPSRCFNIVIASVASEIAPTHPGQRARLPEKFIRLAWKSYLQNNDTAVVAIMVGLQSSARRAAASSARPALLADARHRPAFDATSPAHPVTLDPDTARGVRQPRARAVRQRGVIKALVAAQPTDSALGWRCVLLDAQGFVRALGSAM